MWEWLLQSDKCVAWPVSSTDRAGAPLVFPPPRSSDRPALGTGPGGPQQQLRKLRDLSPPGCPKCGFGHGVQAKGTEGSTENRRFCFISPQLNNLSTLSLF